MTNMYGTIKIVAAAALHVKNGIQCPTVYTEKYQLDYTENKVYSLGVRQTVSDFALSYLHH